MRVTTKMGWLAAAWCVCCLLHSGDVQESGAAGRNDELYMDIFPLSRHNFTQKVLQATDPWIVVLHNGILSRNWKAMAVSVRGIAWVGMVHADVEKPLLDELNFENLKTTEAIIYPYGDQQTKERGVQIAKNANDAKLRALKSLPDGTKRLEMNSLQDFLLDSYTAKPSQFPTVIITEEEDTCPLFKALSNRFQKYFNFVRLVKPSAEDFETLGTGDAYIDIPTVLVLVTDSSDHSKNLGFKAVLYTKDTFGDMTYSNLLQFLFTVNRQFRHTLPGDSQSYQRTEAEMQDILEIEKGRFKIIYQDAASDSQDSSIEHQTSKILQFQKVSKQEL